MQMTIQQKKRQIARRQRASRPAPQPWAGEEDTENFLWHILIMSAMAALFALMAFAGQLGVISAL